MQIFPKIPLAQWVEEVVTYLTTTFGGLFNNLSIAIQWFVDLLVTILSSVPALALIGIFTIIAWWTSRWGVALFTLVGLLFINNLGYWPATIDTLALVLTSVIISIIIGIPFGIWASQSDTVKNLATPVLDFMQTMPAFVYLIPSILFFGIGVVPGIIASVIFAMPPTIRLTNLGIRQVPEDLIEAANAFGSTTRQKLYKIELPLAMPTIMAGINQSIMLALSMVVIASLVGAPGLGADVYRAVTQIRVGIGFEAGLSIVILAIMLDRISQNIGRGKTEN
ncbi:proline/glycine betaine ABC transporter permease [Alkalihalobacillus sp. AL-G]|uniref:ABC transporter permease n=1 Tax=Alkalihalobacillus sp. AL-G TaxID=2926399 RepID=UPI002729B7FD|nr:proline/glycine betaine ABC transporter permease [Alkalihalobacillus sp. AL-G]WLD93432.1 proline/glycine betaine ABC transporter permease [Alkalihalobacillus sp. AL-G]